MAHPEKVTNFYYKVKIKQHISLSLAGLVVQELTLVETKGVRIID